MQQVSRLINKFIPEKYTLSLKIDRINRKFEGLVSILGDKKIDSNEIELHHKDLIINSVIVDGRSVDFDVNQEIIKIHLSETTPGQNTVTISYSGKINDDMHGMYPCYFEHNGTKKELIATQFESHYAREVIPCIDEPESKATYDVTLSTEKNVTVLGNMPIKFQREEGDWLITSFETTPKMSSYLLAWVIGEMHFKSAKTKDGVEVRVWATPAQNQESLDFGLDIAVRSIEFYNEYFKTPYPLSKCDHVALPDFSSGAMENWGLITYRETALLADPKNTSISSKRHIATVITHELSHQWFGNLVTMKWWNDLWLNESFASLIEYTAVNALEPEWKVWLDFASFDSVIALKRDSLQGVQPVQIDVKHPDEISTIFDGAIVYAKGAKLLQMLQNYIGEDNFKTGLSRYFAKFAYKNTIDQDLWNVLSDICNIDINEFMKPWLTQPGFPVLHVEKINDKIRLTQEKLQSHKLELSDSIWPIPLNSNCINAPKILDQKSIEFKACDQQTIRFNIGSTAHFITHYEPNLLLEIVNLIKQNKLSTIDRLQLLNEQVILSSSGVLPNSNLIMLLDAYNNETEDSVWDIIVMVIAELKKFANIDAEIEEKLKLFVKKLASKQYLRLGWNPKDNETEMDVKLRSTILSLMVYSGDIETINKAFDSFSLDGILNINPELRSLIISTVVRESKDDKIFNNLINLYKTTSSIELKQDLALGITSVKDGRSIDQILELLTNTKIIRTQDTARWVAYLLRNKNARDKTWKWIRDNWNWIENTFGSDKSYDNFPRYVANCLFTKKHLVEFSEFYTPLKDQPALKRTIEIGINEISDRIDLINKDKEAVKKALDNF